MNINQIMALLRQVSVFCGSFIISQGYVTGEQYTAITGAVITLIGIGLELWASRKAGTLTQAARLSEVQSVVVTKESLADKVESHKVTT